MRCYSLDKSCYHVRCQATLQHNWLFYNTITNHLELYNKRFQFIKTKVTENLFLVIKSNDIKSLKNQLSTFFYK